jgi:hypothetical protein
MSRPTVAPQRGLHIAWGRLSARQAQRIADAAERDVRWSVEHGRCHRRLEQIAAAGSRGHQSGNVSRTILRMNEVGEMERALAYKPIHTQFWKGARKFTEEARAGDTFAWHIQRDTCGRTCVAHLCATFGTSAVDFSSAGAICYLTGKSRHHASSRVVRGAVAEPP